MLVNVFKLDVGNDDVVDGLVFVGRIKPECASDFTLLKALETLSCLKYDIVAIDLPKPFTL